MNRTNFSVSMIFEKTDWKYEGKVDIKKVAIEIVQSDWYGKTLKKELPRKQILELHNDGKDVYEIAAELKLRAIKDVARFLYLAGIKPNHIEGIRESKSTKEKIVLSQEMYEELLLDAFDLGKTPINLLRSNPKKYIGRSTTPAVATCSKVINEAQEIYNNK